MSSLLPLFLVFISGLGFSIQTLIVKFLSDTGLHASFQCVLVRGSTQMITSLIIIIYERENKVPLFGGTNRIRIILFFRSVVGYGGIAFSFLAVERLPLGDATVLSMLSPFVASIASVFVLHESWSIPDFIATCVSIIGATCVARPTFLFRNRGEDSLDVLGVIYALLSSLTAGFAFIFVRILGTTAKMPWANITFSQGIGQFVLAIPSLIVAQQNLNYNLTVYQVLLLLTGGLVGSLSQVCMTIGMQREKSASASAMRMSDVVFSYIFQILFTSDQINLLAVFGAFLVSASILIVVIFKQVNTESPPTITTSTDEKQSLESDDIPLTDDSVQMINLTGNGQINIKELHDESQDDSRSLFKRKMAQVSQYMKDHVFLPRITKPEKVASEENVKLYSYTGLTQDDALDNVKR